MAKSSTKQVVISKIEQVRDVAKLALRLEDAIKDMLDAEEVQKQTWNDLETDWPFADAPNNLVNADGKILLTEDAANPVSFSGSDIKKAIDRLRDIWEYLQGSGTVATITVPNNPNRDINALTIDE